MSTRQEEATRAYEIARPFLLAGFEELYRDPNDDVAGDEVRLARGALEARVLRDRRQWFVDLRRVGDDWTDYRLFFELLGLPSSTAPPETAQEAIRMCADVVAHLEDWSVLVDDVRHDGTMRKIRDAEKRSALERFGYRA